MFHPHPASAESSNCENSEKPRVGWVFRRRKPRSIHCLGPPSSFHQGSSGADNFRHFLSKRRNKENSSARTSNLNRIFNFFGIIVLAHSPIFPRIPKQSVFSF